MNDEQLDDLRARVARKRRLTEARELKRELYNTDSPLDPAVMYYSTGDLAKAAGVNRGTVSQAINRGLIPATRRRLNTGRSGQPDRWLIHPDDAARYIASKKTAESLDTISGIPLDEAGLEWESKA